MFVTYVQFSQPTTHPTNQPTNRQLRTVYANLEVLIPEDCADATLFAATRPAHVQVADVMLYCTNQSGPRDVMRVGTSLGKK